MMIRSFALALLVSGTALAETTLPRQRAANPVQQRPAQQEQPTDPLFARTIAATDDAAFVLGAIESSRQAVIEARSAGQRLRSQQLRELAASIGRHNEATRARLEAIATRKGWRLPQDNPQRAGSLPSAGEARTAANFILNQISFHETTLDQFRAQLGGQGDAELKRALRDSLPGYQKNLDVLLRVTL